MINIFSKRAEVWRTDHDPSANKQPSSALALCKQYNPSLNSWTKNEKILLNLDAGDYELLISDNS